MKKLPHFLKTTEGKFLTFVLAIILLSFAYYFYAMKSGSTSGTPEQVTITEQDHVRGTAGAKVTLVEFGDFQCPACGAYEPIVRQVVAENAGNIQFVFKHYPLTQIHPNALLAAKASEAAGLQGKFWEMHDMLYDRQQEWSGSLGARDMFAGYATELGLDAAAFSESLGNESLEQKIVAEYKEGNTLGVKGTPTFFVNGKMIQSPGSLEEFNRVIQDAAAGR
jgi:formate-nitrite transporter family protein